MPRRSEAKPRFARELGQNTRTYVKTVRFRCILDKTEEADRLINELGSRKMRSVVIMMAVYRETLGRREARDWKRIGGPIRLPRAR